MLSPRVHASFERRVAIGDRVDRAERLQALRRKRPTERVEIGVGWLRYREEAPLFFVVAGGAMLLLGALGQMFASRADGGGPARLAMAVVLDVAAVACFVRWALAFVQRTEVSVSDGTMVVEHRLAGRAVTRARFALDDLDAVLIVGPEGRQRVVLVGPRNVEHAVVMRQRYFDPPTLVAWFADALALAAAAPER